MTPLDKEFRFTQWDDTTLVVTVDDNDPGDMGEPRHLVDYDNGPTHYVSVRRVETVAVSADAVVRALRSLGLEQYDVPFGSGPFAVALEEAISHE